MRWDFGMVFKDLRILKGISQKNITIDTISRSHLSKIEKNTVMPSFEAMSLLLNQLNVSFSEFEYICNNYKPSLRYEIITEFYSQITNSNVEQLVALERKCRKYLSNNNDIRVQEIIEIVKYMLRLSSNYHLDSKELNLHIVQKSWKRLEKLEIWTFDDIRLVNCLLPLLPAKTYSYIIPFLMRSLEYYQDYPQAKPLILAINVNVATMHLYNKEIDLCLTALNKCLSLAMQAKRADYIGIINVRIGICLNDQKKVESGMILLKTLEEDIIIRELKKEIKQLME